MVIIDFKIQGMISAKEYNSLPFGRQIEYRHKIAEFQAAAKTHFVSQKRKKLKTAVNEFVKLYNVTEFYYRTEIRADYKDDSVQIWYKTAS